MGKPLRSEFRHSHFAGGLLFLFLPLKIAKIGSAMLGSLTEDSRLSDVQPIPVIF